MYTVQYICKHPALADTLKLIVFWQWPIRMQSMEKESVPNGWIKNHNSNTMVIALADPHLPGT